MGIKDCKWFKMEEFPEDKKSLHILAFSETSKNIRIFRAAYSKKNGFDYSNFTLDGPWQDIMWTYGEDV